MNYIKSNKIFETPLIASLLAMSSGSIDAYTFLEHGGVFAGMQTGNLILLGLNISQFNFMHALRLCFSIFLFIVGILIAKIIQRRNESPVNRKRIFIMYEVSILIVTGIVSQMLPDLLVIGLLAFAAAAQLQEFKLLRGKAFNSLMMTGNLSKAATSFYLMVLDHDRKARRVFFDTVIVVASFIVGSILTGFMGKLIDQHAIFITTLPLILILFLTRRHAENSDI
ncbi:YoaK family protein [Nicoliella lavandulae]|uniref:YoaK family protein n=1 Tax=Nicoliella lavandulae TaxID=3082954 RepID=A0ABU8SN24_9LACO